MGRGTLVSQLRASELRATIGQQTVLTPTVTSGDSQTKPNSPPILAGTSYFTGIATNLTAGMNRLRKT